MIFVIGKLVTALMRPLLWMILIPLLAAFKLKDPKKKKRWLIVCAVIGFLCSNKIVVNELAILWETKTCELKKLPRTALVLGGFCEYDGERNKIVFTDAGERLFKAIELYNKKLIDTIIISGGTGDVFSSRNPEALYAYRYLVDMGMDSTRILYEPKSKNTDENAKNTKVLLQKINHHGKVLLITSAFHMKRSVACFNKQKIPVVAYPVHFISSKKRGYYFTDYFLPQSHALHRFDLISKEWVGYLAYKITGKI